MSCFPLLDLPVDILRYHVFSTKVLDDCSLGISRLVCRKLYKLTPKPQTAIAIDAAKHGYLSVLKWIFNCNFLVQIELITEMAIKYNHLEVIKWLYINYGNRFTIMDNCCIYGNLEILQWLHSIDKFKKPYYDSEKNYWLCVAKNGHLHILQWISTLWNVLDKNLMIAAVKGNQMEVLKWGLKKNRSVFNADIYNAAALCGNIGILKWLRENKIRWNEEVCNSAIMRGHLDTLIWCRENGAPWNIDWATYRARVYGHTHITNWIAANMIAE